jgi:hypothetical protein
LLAEKAHAGSKKNKAAARKIDNRITIPKLQQTYRTAVANLQELLLVGAQIQL